MFDTCICVIGGGARQLEAWDLTFGSCLNDSDLKPISQMASSPGMLLTVYVGKRNDEWRYALLNFSASLSIVPL
jgi:hypothetical protein